MNFLLTSGFWSSSVQIALPLALAALGGLLCSRAGFLNVGLEGSMLLGAFFSIAGTLWWHSTWWGVLLAFAVGCFSGAFVVWLSMSVGMGDVLAGLGLDIGAVGLTAFLSEQGFSQGTMVGQTLGPVGPLRQQPLVYVAILAFVVMEVFFRRTRLGLIVRSAGERAEAAEAFGVQIFPIRVMAAGIGGGLAALGGTALSLGVVGDFTDNMTAGRGFIALACIILGRWRPLGAIVAAAFFGIADAVHYQLATQQQGYVGQLVTVLPYVITLIVLASPWARSEGPAEEARGLEPRIG